MKKLPHWPIPMGFKDVRLGLQRVEELLSRLHNPHKNLPPIVHVAGTNGKGSTIAYLKAILEAAGYKVHCYISPHLVRFNERITLAGEEINDDFLYEVIEECRMAAGDLAVTFFEGTTAAAFLAFSKVQADIVLLETGLGGRLDATNVIESPLVSIIAPISYDHIEFLGDSIAQIAGEKAGIIKPHCPTIISWQLQEAFEVLRDKCLQLNSAYFACNHHWNFQSIDDGFIYMESDREVQFPLPSLAGIHQIINASTAVAAVQYLHGYNLTLDHIKYGITHTKWSGRLEQIVRGVLLDILPNTAELWMDGAHNTAGAQMLSSSVDVMLKSERILYVINGRTKGRDIEGFLQFFLHNTELLCSVNVKEEPSSEKSEVIWDLACKMGFRAIACDTITDAVRECVKDANGRRCLILICGSLYLMGDVLEANLL